MGIIGVNSMIQSIRYNRGLQGKNTFFKQSVLDKLTTVSSYSDEYMEKMKNHSSNQESVKPVSLLKILWDWLK